MFFKRIITVSTASAVALVSMSLASAQNPLGNRVNWIGPGGVERDWDEGDMGSGEGINWQSASLPPENFQPDRDFDEYGSISAFGTPGIAVIDHPINISPTDIILGQDGGTSGTLVIRDGGSITVQAGAGLGNGELINGFAGSGRLVLQDNMGTMQLARYRQRFTSTLVARLSATGTFANRVQVSQGVNLAGTLLVEPVAGSGFTLTTGDSWTIIQGAPVSGNFSNVQVDPAMLSNAGQTFAVATAGNAVNISVAQRLVLQVDRFTGAATLVNPAGHSTNIELINYTLSSPAGNLSSADSRWFSFEDDPTKPGWFEANPTASNLSELNPTGSLTFAPGQNHNFGTPLNVNQAAPLGTDRVATNGLTFRYQLPTGQLVDAAVNVAGRFNNLVLVVDPITGGTIIQNQSAQNIEFISYTVSSASGSLLTSWTSLQDQSVPNWFEANPTTTHLSELNTIGSANMAVGDEFNLGTAWNATTASRDLMFQYQTLDGVLRQGTVFFGAKAAIVALKGDYNGDGSVDAADYVMWRNNNINGQQGYIDWRANFGAMASGTATALAQAVPEPSSLYLAIAACGLVLSGKRCRGPLCGRSVSKAEISPRGRGRSWTTWSSCLNQ